MYRLATTERLLPLFLILTTALLFTAGCDQSSLTGEADDVPETASPYATAAKGDDSAVPDQYIVVFNRDVQDVPGLARQLTADQNGTLRHTYEHALKGFAASFSAQAAQALENNPNVAYVEQDQQMWAIAEQTDATWGLDRTDQRDLPLDETYTYNATGAGVTAYIIDTGIRISHNDFNGRASTGYDAFDDGQNGQDCNGHGTHVAGTVGGVEWGIAKDVSLVAVRVLDCEGSGTTSGVIAGVDWVTQQAEDDPETPAVANMSLGGGASDALDDAVRNSIASGVQHSIAAGNGNRGGVHQDACDYSPARVEDAMTISATDDSDTKPRFANYGDCVDWFAPGVSITSAWIDGDDDTNTISGTSMAAPHTAGVAALYLEGNTDATAQEVRDALYSETTKSVVSDSRTSNNHLLYSLNFGDGSGGGDDGDTNEPPTADFSYEVSDLTVDFTDESSDDGSIASWSWDFGDGSSSTEQHPTHTYSEGGTYTVTLTVTDDDGATDETSQDVNVSEGDDSGASEPVIDQFDISTRTSGPWSRATATWAVSDSDGDLEQVTTELLNGDNVVDTQTSSVSGSSASGEHELRTRDSADAVRLTVTDVNGNETVETEGL